MVFAFENESVGAGTRKSLVVVDDETAQREQLVDCLADLDCDIHQAGNGQEALEVIRRHEPELVIMDIRMPLLDGVGVVDDLAGMNPKPKIILMTGDPTSLENAYARRPEVFTIVEKPIPLRVLRRFVIDALDLNG